MDKKDEHFSRFLVLFYSSCRVLKSIKQRRHFFLGGFDKLSWGRMTNFTDKDMKIYILELYKYSSRLLATRVQQCTNVNQSLLFQP